MSTAVTLYDETKFQIFSNPDAPEILDMIRENMGGESISASRLDKITIPPQGMTNWTILDIDGERSVKTIEGIIILQQPIRTMYLAPFGSGPKQRPDCSSRDAKFGTGKVWIDKIENYTEGDPLPTVECKTCPYAQWDSGPNGKGQKCRLQRNLFIIQENSMLPSVLKLPPTSLRNVNDFMMRMASQGIPHYGAVVELSLKRVDTGPAPYSKVEFRKLKTLSKAQTDFMGQMRDALSAMLIEQAWQMDEQEMEVAPE